MNAFDHRPADPVLGSPLMTTPGPADARSFGLGRGFVLRDVVATAFLHPWVMLLVFVLPVLAGVAAAVLTPARFTAEALMVVSVSRESAGSTDIGGYGPAILSIDAPKAVQSEIEIITSDAVARDALGRVGPETLYPAVAHRRMFGVLPPLPPAEQLASASEMLRRSLRADVLANTNTLRVQFDYPDRARAIQMLGTIVDAYFARRRAIFVDSAVTVLTAEVTRNETELESLEQRMTAIKARFNVLDIDQSVHLAAARLDGIVQREDHLREQRQAALAQIASANKRLPGQPPRVFASSEATNQSANDESRNTLLHLQQERDHLAGQYVSSYPPLVALDRKIAVVQASIRANQAASTVTMRETRNPTADLLTAKLAQMQVEADALAKQLDEVERQRKDAEAYDTALLGAQGELRGLSRRRDALDAVYRQFATRAAGARLDDQAVQARGATVRLVQAATAPLGGRSMALSLSLAGLLMGGLFTAAAAMLLTGLRRVFVSPGEVERGLRLPVLASFPSGGKAFDIGSFNPAIAGLAALLLDMAPSGALGQHVQVVQLVATDAQDGRDRLARMLAVELAQAHGRRVLLCDLGADGRAHLADLGATTAQLETSYGGIDVFGTTLPKLRTTGSARQTVLADPRSLQADVEQALGELRETFDVILLVGPLRMETYAQRRLAALVDANLVIVRAEHTDGAQAWLLREAILSSGGNLLGTVFTGARDIMPAFLRRVMA